MHANRATYEAPGVVRAYTRHSRLQAPEQTILDELAPHLADMSMLDIGVGAGRTTLHFAHAVKEYVGVDYAENMVRACRERFPDAPTHVSFDTCDARDMGRFGDGAFDFVLFSFNGLDHIDHEGRIQALNEIHRVCKPGGIFAFSAHNANSLARLFAFRWTGLARRPWLFPTRFVKWLILRRLNAPLKGLAQHPCVAINDGAHGFRLKTHYIRPEAQITQLTETGFAHVRVFTLDGNEVQKDAGLDRLDDYWLYYLCRKPK